MPVPGFQEFMRPLLEAVNDGQERNVRQVYAAVTDRLALTEADRQATLPSIVEDCDGKDDASDDHF